LVIVKLVFSATCRVHCQTQIGEWTRVFFIRDKVTVVVAVIDESATNSGLSIGLYGSVEHTSHGGAFISLVSIRIIAKTITIEVN
jgi:predicted ATPase